MKKSSIVIAPLVFISLFIAGFDTPENQHSATDQYIVIAWNDLGMHCANQEFANMCILPPYNNQTVHVIRVGDQTRPLL